MYNSKLINYLEIKNINKINNKNIDLKYIKIGDYFKIKFILSKSKKVKYSLNGICIKKKNKGINSSFILKNIYFNEIVQHNFVYYSNMLLDIQKLNIKTYENLKNYKLIYTKK